LFVYFIDLFIHLVTGTISATGYLGVIFLMALDAACMPVPSEIIMPFSGFLVSTGRFSFFWAVMAGALGNALGAMIAYLVGYFGGRPFVLKYGKYFFIKEREVHQAERFFARWGEFAIFIARNLPLFRTFISVPAGVAEMNFIKFSLYSFIGSIPWCFAFTYLGYILGGNWLMIRKYGSILDVVTIIVLVFFLGKIIFDYYQDKSPA